MKLNIFAFVLSVFMVVPAVSAEHIVNVYSYDPATKKMDVFSPEFLKINVGDTVRFVPKQGGHDTVSLKGLIPNGAKPWASEFSKEFTYTFTTAGVYAYECSPHFDYGMVGVIQVGDSFPNKPEFTKNITRFKGKGGNTVRRIVAENVK